MVGINDSQHFQPLLEIMQGKISNQGKEIIILGRIMQMFCPETTGIAEVVRHVLPRTKQLLSKTLTDANETSFGKVLMVHAAVNEEAAISTTISICQEIHKGWMDKAWHAVIGLRNSQY